ncbi:anhydro-N-acetylmuramic acid kinase [Sinobacterium caligoides]|uniref:Anhydro-N-acetylmuramic acid kinase n=1 Tax=Sinobacterium caligoides TaxID=933926 RepID=A0A3N2DG68_9GAMM|nr:anhydro-N-acetylmuramic acid kinase [Sinobacterium caligoides]ROR98793.1 anhydro-N-acetylmuramic acid kinase [Sinobacterium caligoides]
MADYYIGLMSGTSLDSIDAVLVDFSSTMQLVATRSHPLPNTLRRDIHRLMSSGDHEIELMGVVDRQFALCQVEAVKKLLADNAIDSNDITAIGSHGQTIRHRPADQQRSYQHAFSLQIGDPNTIAYETQITTVADFRRRDIAANGQGAPLAPLFHRYILNQQKRTADGVVICNIGGFSNPTILGHNTICGFDSGPGNVLMDSWIERKRQQRYDDAGAWARSGTLHEALLDKLLEHEYFALPLPKSTGRESFNLDWLDQQLETLNVPIADADVQRTLLELTARSIAAAISDHPLTSSALYICGGGAHNSFLLQRLTELLPRHLVATTQELGLDPDWVEGCAFAWLAKQAINRQAVDCQAVTGAMSDNILGGIYYA